MAKPRLEPVFPAGFDDDALEEDLAHLPASAEEALRLFRKEARRLGGIPKSRLIACQAEGRDGTRLGGCVKTYIPWPNGRFGAVFVAVTHPNRQWPCGPSPSVSATIPADQTRRRSMKSLIVGLTDKAMPSSKARIRPQMNRP